MDLAKPRVDIGLSTDDLEPQLRFWQHDIGVPFDHLLRIGRGQDQHRHDVNGSVLKINHHHRPLGDEPAAGYRSLVIAREGVADPTPRTDPDGNRLELVPPGHDGITQIGIRLAVRSLDAHRRFYADVLGLPEEAPGRFRAGESLFLLEQDETAASDASMTGPGWRYVTFQVFRVDEVHAHVLERGGREALAPLTLGETARISMVRDPDGNWIELSQRASIVGTLDPS